MSRTRGPAAAVVVGCLLFGAAPPGRSQETAAQERDAIQLRRDYRSQDGGLVREVRLALVCYGGSSLAIYMHGNTKELFRLVQASKALQLDAGDRELREAVVNGGTPGPGKEGAKLTGSTRQWYDRLLELWEKDPQKVRSRVLIDVIAGTSAGGINGVILAKALAHDQPLDALTELWMTKASLGRLTNHYFGLFRILIGHAPVDGDALLGWLYDALAALDEPNGTHSLVPKGDRLDLFVTTTDFFGYPQNLVIGDPASSAEVRNRNVLHFRFPDVDRSCDKDVRNNHFCPYWTPALAFAARASSSIPGVFPPLGVPHALQAIAGRKGGTAAGAPPLPGGLQHDVVSDFFRNYQLQEPKQGDKFLTQTFFVDGGVLDNHPFDPAIAEVLRRPQDQEVRRFLVYLQPDPGELPKGAAGKSPGLLSTILGGLSGLPSGQPILDSLNDIAEHNDDLLRLRDVVQNEEEAAQAMERGNTAAGSCADPASLPAAELFGCLMGWSPGTLDSKLAGASEAELAELGRKLEALAREGIHDLAGRSYVSVRVHSVLEQFVTVIAAENAANYPVNSAHRALVQRIIAAWAGKRGLVGTPDHPGGDLEAQLAFLKDFDVGYLRRQLRFVIDWINTQYAGGREHQLPRYQRRRQLDEAKAAAASEVAILTSLIRGTATDPKMAGPLGHALALFRGLNPWSGVGKLTSPLDQQAAAFVDDPQKLAALDDVRRELGAGLHEQQVAVRQDAFKKFRDITRDWDPADRREILVRYLGFPFWDRQIYPLLASRDLGEFEEIGVFRLSPDDATLLGGGPASQKLTGAKLGHFGAFLSRPGRESDYLWGRLDAAERMLTLLGLPDEHAKALFTAILDEVAKEHGAGQTTPLVRGSIVDARRKQVAKLKQ